ncbi:Mediator of RNA polymerase II transcription subunit 4 [Vanrija pseudolonga]|uniref:Mediator of RNA polymerase II transcription subunit 4 n=1 Tax=Vanrija pseudolonga TaxID=143232 RepID=A0AAF1BIF1_9TREE|nr:Mediator of RNA polymerase II transcription subunit 4 [Vanrija pseudolonga]
MTLPLSDPPIRSALLLALSTQSALLNELFAALPSNSADVPALYGSLVQSSAALDGLARDAEEHQRRWARLQDKKREVEDLERKVRSLVRDLEGGRTELEAMVSEGERVRDNIDASERDPVGVPVLLAHAHALARTTSAPVSSLLAPVERAQAAPWPNEAAMRQGLLFQLEGSMSGVGDVGVVGEEQVPEERHEERHEVVQEDSGRRFDPSAVFQLDLGSDDESDDD